MVRGQGWKYIRYHNGDEYLYDLTTDPGETVNLAEEPVNLTRKQTMIEALKAWQRRTAWPG